MDDLLERHADNVAAANTKHRADLDALREQAAAQIRERITAFGATMLDLVKSAEAAREGFATDLEEIVKRLGDKADDAFSDNLAAISLSAADFGRELDARATFLRTGELPIDDKLPKTDAAPQGQTGETQGQSDEPEGGSEESAGPADGEAERVAA